MFSRYQFHLASISYLQVLPTDHFMLRIIFRASQYVQTLTKNIDINTKIYCDKCIYYENIFHENSINIILLLYMFVFLSIYVIKLYEV
jgi:hypothetical protein